MALFFPEAPSGAGIHASLDRCLRNYQESIILCLLPEYKTFVLMYEVCLCTYWILYIEILNLFIKLWGFFWFRNSRYFLVYKTQMELRHGALLFSEEPINVKYQATLYLRIERIFQRLFYIFVHLVLFLFWVFLFVFFGFLCFFANYMGF